MTVPFTDDLLDYSKDYAQECASSLTGREEFPILMHVVANDECLTVPLSLDKIDVEGLRSLSAFCSRLIDASVASWLAIQVPVWTDITGNIAALSSDPRPHALACEGLAVLIIDNEGADFYAADVRRHGDGVSLGSWHMTAQGPSCDKNGVCS